MDSARRKFNVIWDMKNNVGELVNDGAQLRSLGEVYFSSLLKDEGNSLVSDQLKVVKL